MLHLDLFSGIGGFAYAVDSVWGGYEPVEHIFCEWDKFCQQVLKKHWPESLVYGDIRAITADPDFIRHLHGRIKEQPTEQPYKTLRKSKSGIRAPSVQQDDTNADSSGLQKTRSELQTTGYRRSGVDILTGGFPCQPFSAAGLRRGTADERHLWPEMLRVIQLTKPTWVIAENVRGILTWNDGLVFEQVCSDLEASGYEVQPLIIPAVAVNAPHRRDRVWFIAYRNDTGKRTSRSGTDTYRSQKVKKQQQPQIRSSGQSNDDSNSHDKRLERSTGQSQERWKHGHTGDSRGNDWNKNWLEVATQFCSVDDGLPIELDRFKLSKSAHRKEQLKAYGNAIVPQVAIEIMKGIANGTQ